MAIRHKYSDNQISDMKQDDPIRVAERRRRSKSAAYGAVLSLARHHGVPEAFKDDLEIWDKRTIEHHGDEQPFIWVGRRDGTHVIYLGEIRKDSATDWIRAIMSGYGPKGNVYAYWDGRNLYTCTQAEAEAKCQEFDKRHNRRVGALRNGSGKRQRARGVRLKPVAGGRYWPEPTEYATAMQEAASARQQARNIVERSKMPGAPGWGSFIGPSALQWLPAEKQKHTAALQRARGSRPALPNGSRHYAVDWEQRYFGLPLVSDIMDEGEDDNGLHEYTITLGLPSYDDDPSEAQVLKALERAAQQVKDLAKQLGHTVKRVRLYADEGALIEILAPPPVSIYANGSGKKQRARGVRKFWEPGPASEHARRMASAAQERRERATGYKHYHSEHLSLAAASRPALPNGGRTLRESVEIRYLPDRKVWQVWNEHFGQSFGTFAHKADAEAYVASPDLALHNGSGKKQRARGTRGWHDQQLSYMRRGPGMSIDGTSMIARAPAWLVTACAARWNPTEGADKEEGYGPLWAFSGAGKARGQCFTVYTRHGKPTIGGNELARKHVGEFLQWMRSKAEK